MPKTSFSNNFHDFYPWDYNSFVVKCSKYKAYIASESIYNPRAFRALEQALDPSRKGPRASRTISRFLAMQHAKILSCGPS